MRRAARLALFLIVVAAAAFAQEEGKKEGGEPEPDVSMWKWANFLVLAGGLGYLIGKNAPPFFASRSKQIRKDMMDADEARQEADARAAAVDLKLANLQAEITALRAESQKEALAETERMTQHTAAEIAKIQAHAEQEIVAAGKAARADLKRHAAELAIGLAEQKLRARMTPDAQDALVRGFVRDLQ